MRGQTIQDWSSIEPHVWLGSYTPGGISEQPFKDNVLAFVERHDLTVVLSRWNTTEADAEALDEQLRELKERGIDAWLGTYDLREHSDAELLSDEDALESDLERLLRMVGTYADYYPDGNVFLWHEAPLTGQWTGETRGEQAESIARNGGEIFAAQKRAVADQYPDVDLGLMIHYPYIAPPAHSNCPILGSLLSDLDALDAVPDFTYFDFYRGYHEWEGGYEGVNEFLASVIENIREHTGDKPIYYLGECHSINNHYTPSKQSILGNLWTALEAGVDSYGWYIRKGFRETIPRNYNPFLPNVGSVEEPFNTLVGSRDRFVWANLALLEAVEAHDPGDRFDLWVYGHDFDFYEYDLSLRAESGEWEFVGSFSGYVDGDHPYSGGDRDRAVAFHALDRDRYLSDGDVELRIEPSDDADGATVKSVHVVPSLDTCHYLTEPEITSLVEESSDLNAYALGSEVQSLDLSTDDRVTIEVAVDRTEASLEEVARPEARSTIEELADVESSSEFVPSSRFDLWVYGEHTDAVLVSVGDTSLDEYRSADADGGAATVYRGLERSEFLEKHTGGHDLGLRVDAEASATIDAVFAMPYHGTANFTPDTEVAAIVEAEYEEREGQLTTFSLGHQIWPGGRDLDAGESVTVWVGVPDRKVVMAREAPEY